MNSWWWHLALFNAQKCTHAMPVLYGEQACRWGNVEVEDRRRENLPSAAELFTCHYRISKAGKKKRAIGEEISRYRLH